MKQLVQQKDTMARLQQSNPSILQQLVNIIQEQQQEQELQSWNQQQQQQQQQQQNWNQWGGNGWNNSYTQAGTTGLPTGLDLSLLIEQASGQVASQGGTWDLANLTRRNEGVIGR